MRYTGKPTGEVVKVFLKALHGVRMYTCVCQQQRWAIVVQVFGPPRIAILVAVFVVGRVPQAVAPDVDEGDRARWTIDPLLQTRPSPLEADERCLQTNVPGAPHKPPEGFRHQVGDRIADHEETGQVMLLHAGAERAPIHFGEAAVIIRREPLPDVGSDEVLLRPHVKSGLEVLLEVPNVWVRGARKAVVVRAVSVLLPGPRAVCTVAGTWSGNARSCSLHAKTGGFRHRH
mmetsp:Transcript_142554/g.443336  ORF Transcript_142554/g.443336 Transcript_142554/m.443336 type:complete len:231 (+) Transcript_142554:453-1145(+)